MNRRGKISLLLLFISVCAAAAVIAIYRHPPPATISHRELYEIVCEQVDAFRLDDFSSAYAHASNEVREQFTVVTFQQMIRANYSGILESRHVELGPVHVRGGSALVELYFVSDSGTVQPCIYKLVREHGRWKIDGARMLPRWPAGAGLSGSRT